MPDRHYRVFGLTVKSPVALTAETVDGEGADVVIKYGSVADPSMGEPDGGVLYRSVGSDFLFGLEDRLRFSVRNGREICIQCEDDENPEFVRLMLQGSPFGALLHQRGLLALHGCTVLANGRAYAIVGRSGVGKSTLAAGLAARGHSVYADDITALSIGQGSAEAFQGFCQIKLYGDSVRRLGRDPGALRPLRPGVIKLGMVIPPVADGGPVPLQGIFVLDISSGAQIEMTALAGATRLTTLLINTYRSRFLKSLGLMRENYEQCAAVAQGVPIWQILRPRTPFLLDELLDAIDSRLL
jgi:hypothetical protein